MSTKIYHGIKFKSDDIFQIHTQLKSIRESIIERNHAYLQHNIKEYVMYALLKMLKDKQDKVKELMRILDKDIAFMDISCEIIGAFESRCYHFTPLFRFSVLIFPFENKFYGYYIDETRKNRDLLFQFVTDYHYQNQSDKPENITEEDWEERSRVWNSIEIESRLNYNALTFELVTEKDIQLTWLFENVNKVKCEVIRSMLKVNA